MIAGYVVVNIRKKMVNKFINKKNLIFLTAGIIFLFSASFVSAHLPRVVYNQQGIVQIENPEISQAFYDQLNKTPKYYTITSDKEFDFYINLLVPANSNYNGKYSARVFGVKDGKETQIIVVDGQTNFEWKEFYEEFGRDYYLKGPEFNEKLSAGTYKIEVFNNDNSGKYVLVVGQKEQFTIQDTLNVYWQIPLLKWQFFNTPVWQFLLTPFGIAGIIAIFGLIIFGFFVNFIVAVIRQKIYENSIKTLVLTSAGMQVKDEILKLIAKPTEDVTVAYIVTASSPEQDKTYVYKDKTAMQEIGFNVEDIDIKDKTESQLMSMLENKDIIYVQGGNTFYLLKYIRKSGFDKVVKKLLKKGIMYIGVSAGSIVAGRDGMRLVNFNIFVHYTPEYAEVIKQKPKKALKNLRILTDDQAIIIQGKEVVLVGKGNKIDPLNL